MTEFGKTVDLRMHSIMYNIIKMQVSKIMQVIITSLVSELTLLWISHGHEAET